jgi:hypothetical protein
MILKYYLWFLNFQRGILKILFFALWKVMPEKQYLRSQSSTLPKSRHCGKSCHLFMEIGMTFIVFALHFKNGDPMFYMEILVSRSGNWSSLKSGSRVLIRSPGSTLFFINQSYVVLVKNKKNSQRVATGFLTESAEF